MLFAPPLKLRRHAVGASEGQADPDGLSSLKKRVSDKRGFKMNIFIICPVRNLTDEEKTRIENYIMRLEKMGHSVHFPPRDTNQKDRIGSRICLDNLSAIKRADEVHIWWNNNSEGSKFDFGMAFALGKKIVIINSEMVLPTEYKSFSNVLLELDLGKSGERYKLINQAAYFNENARQYMESTADYWIKFPEGLKTISAFVGHLPGRRVLDLGSGGGRDSALFKAFGLEPLCLDISNSMLAICREKGLEAMVADMENLPFAAESFDGVWAYASLHHVPKRNMGKLLGEINGILKPGGAFLATLKEGSEEGWMASKRMDGVLRYVSLWGVAEFFRELRSAGFRVISTIFPAENFFDVVCVKR